MATGLLAGELWKLIEPLLPVRRFRHPGRKRLDDRPTLAGIMFVLRTGIAWQQLPQELGYGSGMTQNVAGAGRLERFAAVSLRTT
jgi:transposase